MWIAGALGFFLPQMVIRIPLLQVMSAVPGFQRFASSQPCVFVFLLALSAALLETTGRLVVLKIALAKKLSYLSGLAAGAGHGEIKAIFLIGVLQINNVSVLVVEGLLMMIALISLLIRPRFGENTAIPLDPGEQAVNEVY